MTYKTDILTNALKELNIELNNDQISAFMSYYEILVEKNKVMNLTAITDFEDVMIKHFADSLSITRVFDINDYIEKNGSINILDMGTGAGFPGIPLKIAYPEINITLADSLAKRINFLNEVIDILKLNGKGNISTVHTRAEDYIKQPGIRESYDLAVSRAVANMSVLSEYCIPYVRKGGCFIPYKSEKAGEELKSAEKAISILGGTIDEVCSFTLPGSVDMTRTLIVIKKTRHTQDIYPRKAGLPSKNPL